MKFQGTIVITDPCYLDNGEGNLDLWEASGYGEDLSVFGCSQWISEGTIYGDWSCTTYQVEKEKFFKYLKGVRKFYDKLNDLDTSQNDFETLRDSIYEEIDEFSEPLGNMPVLGRFCADAGMVCVVYLDEVLKINPYFQQWAEEHPWCVTIIENFEGDVEYVVDDSTEAHIVGKGSINFCTTQTGL